MIYTFKTPMGSGTPENVVLMAKIDTPNGVLRVKHNDLFHSDRLEILEKQNLFLRVKGIEGEDIPFIVAYGGTSKDFTQLLPVLQKLKSSNQLVVGDPTLKALLPKMSSIFGVQFSDVDLVTLYEAYQEFIAYKKKDITVHITVTVSDMINPEVTQKIVDKYKSTTRPKELWFLDEKINVSSKMKTPEDRVFLRLPEYESLITSETSEAFVAELPSLIQPYPAKELHTPYYMDYIQTKDPSYDVANVIGNPANNDLPIQPNEEEFYKALCSLGDYTEKHKTEVEDVADEDADLLASLRISNASFINLNEDFKNFAIALLDKALAINYMHTGFVPVSAVFDVDNDSLDSDDESDKTISTSEIQSSYEFYETDKQRIGEASELVLAYVNKETNGDYHALCEAIVKLLRWGDRKPSKLKVTGAKNYLSLDTFRTESNSGNFAAMEVKTINGCALLPSPYKIRLTDNIKDTSYFKKLGLDIEDMNVPVGLVLHKKYLAEDNSAIIQDIHTPIIDIVYNLVMGETSPNSKVYGISYDKSTNKIIFAQDILDKFDKSVALGRCVTEVTSDQESRVEFYQSGAVKDIFFEFNSMDKIKCSCLYQLNRFRALNNLNMLESDYTTSKSELIELCSSGITPVEALSINMVRQVLQVTVSVNDRIVKDTFNGVVTTLEQVFNYYLEEMQKIGFNYGAFDNAKASYVSSKLEDIINGGENTQLKELDVFSNDTVEENDVDTVQEDDRLGRDKLNRLIYEVPDGVSALWLYKPVIIDGVAKKRLIVLVHLTEVNGKSKLICVGRDKERFAVQKSGISTDKVGSIPSEVMSNILKGTPEESKFLFASEAVLQETIDRCSM